MLKKLMYCATILALLSCSIMTTSCTKDDPTQPEKPSVPLTPVKPQPTPEPEPAPEPEPEVDPVKIIEMSWLTTYDAAWWRTKAASVSITAADLREADPTKPEEQFATQVSNGSGCLYSGVPSYFDFALMFPNCDDNARKPGELAFIFLDASRNIVGNTYTEPYDPSRGYAQDRMIFTTMDLAPGSYYAVPLYRPHGEQKWILPSLISYSAFAPFEGLSSLDPSRWGFELKAVPQDYLTLYHFTDPETTYWLDFPGGSAHGRDGAFMFVDQGEKFTSRFTICNPSGKAVSGTLTYKDIRSFSLDHAAAMGLEASGRVPLEWDREIGSCHIEIPAGTQVIQGYIDGVLNEPNNPDSERYRGGQYLFFTPDGSSESYLISLDERRIMSAFQGIPQAQWSDYAQQNFLMMSHTGMWTNQKVDDQK